MLRPSQVLLRRVPITQNPLDFRESRKLLDFLTSTFRRHLDNDIPNLSSKLNVHAAAMSPGDQDGQRRDDLAGLVLTGAGAGTGGGIRADSHLRSILSNPLLNHAPKHINSNGAMDPIDVLDAAVARGTQTMKVAELCLKAKKLQIMSSVPKYSHVAITKHLVLQRIVRTAMQESGAGRRVLKHLLASGLVDESSFWTNEHLTPILTIYLTAEGLQEHVWYALSRLAENFNSEDSSGETKEQQISFDRLSSHLVVAEAWGCESLDNACTCLLRATKLAKGTDDSVMGMSMEKVPWTLFKVILGRMNLNQKLQISPAVFDSIIQFFDADFRSRYPSALLHMLHPTHPSAEKALKLLRGKTKHLTTSNKVMLRLGLETASFLKEHQDFIQAKSVLTMLANRYPKELGIIVEADDNNNKGQETLASLLRLESLGVA